MDQNVFMLLATAVFGALAALFAIIGVAASGWPPDKWKLFGCGSECPHNNTEAGVLLIIAIVFLGIGSLFAIIILRSMRNGADRIKGPVLALLIIAGICIVAAYSGTIDGTPYRFYSYHLTATAGILAFLSAIFFTYWIGRTSVFDRS